jgi:hypothetical protein
MDADLFHEHPELRDGAYEAAYVGNGTLLLRRSTSESRKASSDVDPVVAAYLAWTEQAMIAHPELLRSMTEREFRVAEELVAGVEVDLEDDRLPEDFELP